MKVKKLIKELEQVNENAEVFMCKNFFGKEIKVKEVYHSTGDSDRQIVLLCNNHERKDEYENLYR